MAIVGLMQGGLPTAVTRRIVHWFFRWAHAEKVAHRQFALEVMGKLLLEGEEQARIRQSSLFDIDSDLARISSNSIRFDQI